MQFTLLKAELHRACVTHTDASREEAFSIDGDLLDRAGIQEYEQIQVYNINSGERLTSYAVRAEHGSRKVAVYGASAFKAGLGDRLIICAYAGLNGHEVAGFKPVLVHCNRQNQVTDATGIGPMQMVS